MDVSKVPETLKIRRVRRAPSFMCLLARRLIERGVRFVQLFHEGWDHHSEVANGVRDQTKKTDQASAALIQDLKQRGLLEDTLVLWGGEFGRTPMVEANSDFGRKLGRDHHPQAFTMAGRRWHPARHHHRRDRRIRLQCDQDKVRARSHAPFCIVSGSITRSSPSGSRAGIIG
jgi:hypothetical protein